MKINDAVIGAFLLVLGVVVFDHAGTFRDIPGQNVGPSAFPRVIAGGLILFSLPLIVRGVRDWRRPRQAPAQPAPATLSISAAGLRNAALTLLLVGLYIGASHWTGFLPMGFAIVAVLLAVQGVRLWLAAAVAASVTAVAYYAFAEVLRVPLPWGPLERLLW